MDWGILCSFQLHYVRTVLARLFAKGLGRKSGQCQFLERSCLFHNVPFRSHNGSLLGSKG